MTTQALLMTSLVLLSPPAAIAQTTTAQTAQSRVLITDAGAVADGTTLNTRAIQKAVDDLAEKGGGTVVIPAGKFLSGAIFLKPRVNLHLEKDAVLLGSTNIDDYPASPTRIEGHTQVWRPALVNADKCDDLQLTGEGTIQGGGKPYWDAFWNRYKADKTTRNLDVDRPRNIFIRDSRGVVVSGLSLRESGFWNLHLYRCRSATIENLDIRTPPGSPSTDGIDLDSCQDVTVRDCYISVDDDNIALKGSKGPLADRDTDSPAVERIHITDCRFGSGHGVVTLGSEACHVKGVLVENCKVEDAADAIPGTGARNRTILVRLKLRPDTPQHYEDLHFRNITFVGAGDLISIAPWTQYFDLQGQPEPAQLVENVTIENITGSANALGRMAGPKHGTLRNIALRNIDLQSKTAKPKLDPTDWRTIEGLTIDNVKLNGEPFAPPK